jgi:hypothetical protein
MRQYIIKCLFIQTQPMWALIDTDGGYHIQSSELTTYLSPTFPSGILHFSLVTPPGLILNQLSTIQILNHSIHKPGYKRP